MMSIHTDDLSKFLSAVWPVIPDGQWVLFWGIPSKRSSWVQEFKEETLTMLQRWAEKEDVYIGCGTRGANLGATLRGGSEDVTAIPGLWLDIDYGTEHKKPNLPPMQDDAVALIQAMGLPPTMIVHTGHGLHAWWVFREPWILETAEDRDAAHRLTSGWSDTLRAHAATRGWATDSVGDLPRVMRLPGLWNRKGTPLKTKLLSVTETALYNVSEIEPYLLQQTPQNEQLPDITWQFELSPKAEPPAEKFAALMELDIKFRLSWLHNRVDLQDQSASSYDLSLATRAFSAEWDAQEIVNLLIAHRRKHNDGLKLRKDYYARTLSKALSGRDEDRRKQAVDDLKAGKLIPESIIADPAENLAVLSRMINVEITRFLKYRGQDNFYQLVINERKIDVHRIDDLECQRRFRRLILDHTNILISKFKQGVWDTFVSQLFRSVQEIDVMSATKRDSYEYWIEMYLGESGVNSEDRWEKAAALYQPFRIKNETFIPAEGFRQFLVVRLNEKISSQRLKVELTKLGYEHQRVNVPTLRGKQGERTRRSIWKVRG